MEGYEIVRCPKCDKWKVVFKEDEPRPEDLMNKKLEIKKCSCEEQLMI